jgi:hypothetical protein
MIPIPIFFLLLLFTRTVVIANTARAEMMLFEAVKQYKRIVTNQHDVYGVWTTNASSRLKALARDSRDSMMGHLLSEE